jgi:hypothetical protein
MLLRHSSPARCPRVPVAGCPSGRVSGGRVSGGGCPVGGCPVSGWRVSGVRCPGARCPVYECPVAARLVSDCPAPGGFVERVGAADRAPAIGSGRLRRGRPPCPRAARSVAQVGLARSQLAEAVLAWRGSRTATWPPSLGRSGGGCVHVRPPGRPGTAGCTRRWPVGWLGITVGERGARDVCPRAAWLRPCRQGRIGMRPHEVGSTQGGDYGAWSL